MKTLPLFSYCRSKSQKRAAPLAKYGEKRNLSKTPEPPPAAPLQAGRSYVIQEHYASHHHFDFRHEIDGVLVSWAVPKGIPEDTAARQLAVHVEEHPLEYGKFQGTIPKGNYGAGEVIIWDQGEWEPLEPDWRKQFEKGYLKFYLQGTRLNGPLVLARMKEEPNWLLKILNPATHAVPAKFVGQREEAAFIAPQLAHVVGSVPSGPQWVHELKFDGYRLVAVQNDRQVTLYTRSGPDWT